MDITLVHQLQHSYHISNNLVLPKVPMDMVLVHML